MTMSYSKPGVSNLGQMPNGSAQSKLLPGVHAICRCIPSLIAGTLAIDGNFESGTATT